MAWLPDLPLSVTVTVSAIWTQHLLRKVRLDLAQIASTMVNQADVHSESMYRGFAMAEMLHHLSVILLLIALVFLYSMDSAVAISVSPVVVLYRVAQLKPTNLRKYDRGQLLVRWHSGSDRRYMLSRTVTGTTKASKVALLTSSGPLGASLLISILSSLPSFPFLLKLTSAATVAHTLSPLGWSLLRTYRPWTLLSRVQHHSVPVQPLWFRSLGSV